MDAHPVLSVPFKYRYISFSELLKMHRQSLTSLLMITSSFLCLDHEHWRTQSLAGFVVEAAALHFLADNKGLCQDLSATTGAKRLAINISNLILLLFKSGLSPFSNTLSGKRRVYLEDATYYNPTRAQTVRRERSFLQSRVHNISESHIRACFATSLTLRSTTVHILI